MADTPRSENEIMTVVQAARKYKVPWQHVYNVARKNKALLQVGYSERINMLKMPKELNGEITEHIEGGEDIFRTTLRIPVELEKDLRIHAESIKEDINALTVSCIKLGLQQLKTNDFNESEVKK